MQHDKYAWRLPREKSPEDDSPTKAWLRTFFSSIGQTVADWARTVLIGSGAILDWFDKHFLPKPKPVEDGGARHFDWAGLLRWFAYRLARVRGGGAGAAGRAAVAPGLAAAQVVRAEIVPARPDLNDASVTAAQLPEDEWLKLAGELLNQGDLRLALRAFYLATLAHLAAREIVSLARFKSNHDYEIEVQPPRARLAGIARRLCRQRRRLRPRMVWSLRRHRRRAGAIPVQFPTHSRMLKRPAILFASLLFVAVFVLGLVRLFELRLDRGDLYPPYSTLRTDPLGVQRVVRKPRPRAGRLRAALF